MELHWKTNTTIYYNIKNLEKCIDPISEDDFIANTGSAISKNMLKGQVVTVQFSIKCKVYVNEKMI